MIPPTASLTVRKTLPCSPAEAFRAWTVPELFREWFVPASGIRVAAEMDLRTGGKYQIRFQMPEGKGQVIVDGEFLVIREPSYLEYTWTYVEREKPGMPKNTVVKISFNELSQDSTELVLTHEGFVEAEDRDDHNSGWTGILDCMATAMAKR